MYSKMSSPRRCDRLALKRERRPSPDDPPPPPPKETKKKVPIADLMKMYREKRKQDPERYEKYQRENKVKCRAYRANMTADKKAQERENGKERVRNSRQRKKELKQAEPPRVTTRKDIAAQEAQREKWRQEKKKQADGMHWRTKQARNEKRRLLYRQKRDRKQAEGAEAVPILPSIEDSEDTRTRVAKRKALQRAKGALPNSPGKYVATVRSLIDKSSPRKKRLFDASPTPSCSRQQEVGSVFINSVRCLKDKTSAADRVTRRVLLDVMKGTCSVRKRSSLLDISRRTLKKHDIKWKPVKRLRTAEASATSFLEDMATPLPDKKLVSKKTGKGASLLQQSLRELHREFCSSGNLISFSTFAKCRPPNVRLMAQACLRQCLCEYCANVELLLTALNAVAAA